MTTNPDVSTDSSNDAPNDVVQDAPVACNPTKAFGAPQLIGGLAPSTWTACPRLSPDELTIYFEGMGGALTDAGHTDLYTATRSTTSVTFGIPQLIGVNTNNGEYNASVTSDGLTLFFTTWTPSAHVWFATRMSTLAGFTGGSELAGVASSNTSDNDAFPFVTADSAELWFSSSRSGGMGMFDIYDAPQSGMTYANPVAQSTLNSSGNDNFPALSADRLTIYISSDRTGGMGGLDIYRSMRASTADPFPTPTLVPELNSASDDLVGWISPDNCRAYMSSTRNGGNWQTYIATRTPGP